MAKMGLVLEIGAHFQDVCISRIFQKKQATVVFSVPLGVRGPLRAPSGRPRGPPLGPPWQLLRPRRTTQPTVVINVRSASRFGQNGPDAREGCTFVETLFFLAFSKIHPLPLGLPRPLLRPLPFCGCRPAPRAQKEPQQEPPTSNLGRKGTPKRTSRDQLYRTEIKY